MATWLQESYPPVIGRLTTCLQVRRSGRLKAHRKCLAKVGRRVTGGQRGVKITRALMDILDLGDVSERVAGSVGCHSILLKTSVLSRPVPAYRASVLKAWHSLLDYLADKLCEKECEEALEALICKQHHFDHPYLYFPIVSD